MKRVCVQCGKEFYLSKNEIKYFKERKLSLPRRCKECRALNKAKKKEETPVVPVKEKKSFLDKLLSLFKK